MKTLRDLLRWWELRRRLKKCKTPEERTKVRRSLGQKYRTQKPRDIAAIQLRTNEIERLKTEQHKRERDMTTEAKQAETRG